MAHDVFISYSSKDKIVADSIVSALENSNIRCWYAPRDIKPGQDWGEAITEAIDECKVFLIIFSENANRSQRVLDEVNLAIESEAVLLPFRIENLAPDGAMKLHLSSRHWLDAFDPSWRSHIDKLVKEVSSNLAVKKKKTDKQGVGKPGGKIWIPLGILIAAVLIIVGWFGYSVLFGQDDTSMAQSSELLASSQTQVVEQEPTFTFTPASTSTPEPTLTPTPTLIPDWVAEVSEPILTAIENRSPDFEDDFSIEDDGWFINPHLTFSNDICTGASTALLDGVLNVNLVPDCPMISMSHYQLWGVGNYVQQIDVNFNGALNGDIYFSNNFGMATELLFEIHSDGMCLFRQFDGESGEVIDDTENTVSFDPSEPLRVTMIYNPPVFLAYIDSTLVIARNDIDTDSGPGNLSFDVSAHEMSENITIDIDNFSVWDLDALNSTQEN